MVKPNGIDIARKTAVMLSQFMNLTRHKIGGRAKAMVVAPSRLHAVRYFQEWRRQIRDKGYSGLGVLAAFSGEVADGGETYTEEKLNKTADGKTIKEKALPAAFRGGDFRILIVAEKYQTGFDEPLLHTMFVDKKLSGVKAVQTLSRLNRIMGGKEDTFVLDFVNSAEDIKNAFAPYFEATVLEKETDPNVVYDLRLKLDEYQVYQENEIDSFADLFFSAAVQSGSDLGILQSYFRPALDRFRVLADNKQKDFKTDLAKFNRSYAFITQVCRLNDKKLHKFSVYAKFLAILLPKGENEKVDVDGIVSLEYYRLQKDFEGRIELAPTPEGFKPVFGETAHPEKKTDPLTALIGKINAKYGTEFTETDRVLLEIENDYAAQDVWKNCARINDLAGFHFVFDQDFRDMAIRRFEQGDAFFAKMFEDDEMMQEIMNTIGGVLYKRLRDGGGAGQSPLGLVAERQPGYGKNPGEMRR